MTSDHRTHFLCIDFGKATITRYVHHRGTWGISHLRTVQVEPHDAIKACGEMRETLEKFRQEGAIDG